MNVCIQIFISYYALEKVGATILENQLLPSSFNVFKVQTFQYPRFNYPTIRPFLKIRKLLNRSTESPIITFFRCKSKILRTVHPSRSAIL